MCTLLQLGVFRPRKRYIYPDSVVSRARCQPLGLDLVPAVESEPGHPSCLPKVLRCLPSARALIVIYNHGPCPVASGANTRGLMKVADGFPKPRPRNITFRRVWTTRPPSFHSPVVFRSPPSRVSSPGRFGLFLPIVRGGLVVLVEDRLAILFCTASTINIDFRRVSLLVFFFRGGRLSAKVDQVATIDR